MKERISRETLMGVNISVKENPKVRAITRENGDFLIQANKGETLVFDFLGLETKYVKVKSNKLKVVMSLPNELVAGESISIGYGRVTKKNLTVAVGQVNNDDLKNSNDSDLGSSIQGKISGVSVVTDNSPGATSTIQIRGDVSILSSTEPLFVVDGIPQDGNPNISVNEIESIEVLKDAASTAIYGTRGASGVVLITTKRGGK
ncbi:MAG: TonB-dependent receptor plug domain-containing protein [Rikenellaceae bacterium]